MHQETFNANFYITVATVIPVLFLALTLQGSTFQRLLKRAPEESYKLLVRELNKGNQPWLQRQAENWSRALLVTIFIYANMAILVAGILGESAAIVALYHESASPTSGELVLIAVLALLAVIAGDLIFIIATSTKLTDLVKERGINKDSVGAENKADVDAEHEKNS